MQPHTQKHMQEKTPEQSQSQRAHHTHHPDRTHHTDDCEGIACIVRAVRAGDDRLIGTLLQRFAQYAELDSLFRLREALEHDADPVPQASVCRTGR